MGMVRLDIRQESTRHSDAINAVTDYLGLGSYTEWDEEKRLAFLVNELTGKRPLLPPGMRHYLSVFLHLLAAKIRIVPIHWLCP